MITRPGQSTEYQYPSRVKVFSEKSTWVQVKVLSSKKYSGKSKSIFKSTRVLLKYFLSILKVIQGPS